MLSIAECYCPLGRIASPGRRSLALFVLFEGVGRPACGRGNPGWDDARRTDRKLVGDGRARGGRRALRRARAPRAGAHARDARRFFAAFAAIDGGLAAAAGARLRAAGARVHPMLWEGGAGLAAAALAVVWPGITVFVLLLVVAAWALATGALALVLARQLRGRADGGWLLAVAGAVSVLFGGALIAFPAAGMLGMVWWIGSFAIVHGAALVALGVRMRGATRSDDRMLAV